MGNRRMDKGFPGTQYSVFSTQGTWLSGFWVPEKSWGSATWGVSGGCQLQGISWRGVTQLEVAQWEAANLRKVSGLGGFRGRASLWDSQTRTLTMMSDVEGSGWDFREWNEQIFHCYDKHSWSKIKQRKFILAYGFSPWSAGSITWTADEGGQHNQEIVAKPTLTPLTDNRKRRWAISCPQWHTFFNLGPTFNNCQQYHLNI